jgi:HEPN domain-containing protein
MFFSRRADLPYFWEMKCQADIQALAKAKLAEADCLLRNGFFDAAFYIGGYAVELMLKARVCKTLGIDDFFQFKKGKPEIYRPYKVHDYEYLIILSGIYADFDRAQANVSFKTDWSIVSAWNENARYLTGTTEATAKDFLTSVSQIVKWIETFL